MPKKDWADEMDAQQIRKAIEMTGLSRRDLAAKLEVTLGAVDKWIGQGRIPADQNQKIQNLIIRHTLAKQGPQAAVHSNMSAIMPPLDSVTANDRSEVLMALKAATDSELLRELLSRKLKVTLSLAE